MKNAAFIMLALFIDGVQAAISTSLAVITAFPGTIGGGAAGCLAGNYIAGSVGCFVLGLAGGLFGTLLDAAAVVTEPVGIVLGFAVTICFSCTFGVALVFLLGMNGMFYPKYVFSGGITEVLPGFSIIPGWTAMTILCVLKKSKERGGVLGAVAGVATAASSPSIGSVAGVGMAMDGIRAPQPQTNAA